jgi:hypothetical protein
MIRITTHADYLGQQQLEVRQQQDKADHRDHVQVQNQVRNSASIQTDQPLEVYTDQAEQSVYH